MATNQGNTFVIGFDVTAALTSAYLVPDTVVTSTITNARVHNYDTVPRTFTVQVIPSGQSADDLYIAIGSRSIAPNETILLSEVIGEPLQTGDDFQISASAADALSLTLGGTNQTS